MALIINDNGKDREMTPAEEADYKAWQVLAKADDKTEQEASALKAAAKNAVLAKLGLSAEEAAALLK